MNAQRTDVISSFYKPVLRLTLPIVIQNLLSVAVSSADVMMLSQVGQSAVSSVSLASQYTQVLYMFLYGIGTGATTLCAQYWGKKDVRAIELIEGIALRFSLALSLLVTLLSLTVPELLMQLFTNDPELIALGTSYLRAVCFSYIFWSISEIYLACLRSVERVTISTALNALALGLNVALNAVFIFGLFGAPKLGVMGVGVATSISRGIQLLCCIAVSSKSRDVHLRLSMIFRQNKVLFRDFLRLALPAVGNDLSWSVAFSMYSVILGHISSDMVAANSIVSVVRNFATVLCYAFASATTIWLGKKMGQDKIMESIKDSKRFMLLTVSTGALGGLVIFLISPFVLRSASLSAQALHYMKYMLMINTVYVVGTAVNSTLIAGVFRAGGDTRFGLICDTIDMWCYAVPLGFFSAFVLKLPPMWVYFLICTDEFVKWPVVLRHYRSNKWVHNITKSYE